MSRHLLTGAITNYVWDDIAPFFNSYKQAGFDDCGGVMFCGNMSARTPGKPGAAGVKVHTIPESLMNAKIINLRWKIYAGYLNDHKGQYDMVFTADVRDVIFQSDVFRCYDSSTPFPGVAIEDENISQNINREWITDAYGQEIYEQLRDNRIICVGNVWGTPEKFTEFCNVMWERLGSEWSLRLNVTDQAVENYIIYHDKMFADVLRPSTNHDGVVLTNPKAIFNSSGQVLNEQGEIAAVVHQYDRNPVTCDAVLRKYGEGMSWFAKQSVRHFQDFGGRILSFLSRVHRRGLIRSVKGAIQRRL